MAKTVLLRIHGRVQGVGFRAWTVDAAGEFGVAGWVRNRADGSVEALASGEPVKVDRFVDACRRGPRLAFVSSLKIEPAEPEDGLVGFQPRPTV